MIGSVMVRVKHRCTNGRLARNQWPAKREPKDDTPKARCATCGVDLRDGDRQYVAVYRAGGKQRWKTFAKRSKAEKHLTGQVKHVGDGTYQDVRPARMADVFDRWETDVLDADLAAGDLKPSYAKSCRSILNAHLRPAFAESRSDQLQDAVADFLRSLATKQGALALSRKSAKNIVGTLGIVLEWGREERFLAADPLEAHRRRARKRRRASAGPPAREVRHLEPAELHALLKAAKHDPVAEMILFLAAYSGIRRGEEFSVQWDDLDEAACQLHIRRSIYQGAITRPKTAGSIRRIDLPAPLVARLVSYRERYPPIGSPAYIFRTDPKPATDGSKGFAGGTTLDPDNWFKRVFIPIAIAAGLRTAATNDKADTEPDTEAPEPLGLHSLRHTYASMLIAQGENFKYISRQLGHATIAITLDRYGHLLKETSTSAMARLGMRMPQAEIDNVVTLATGTTG